MYISGNPLVNSGDIPIGFFAKPHFSKIIDTWKTGWDEKFHTVPPDAISTTLLSYSGKVVAHYVQPHLPYIGETKLYFDVRDREGNIRNFNMMARRTRDDVLHGKITIETLRQAYEDNLKLVLESFSGVLDKLGGKIIITSDHGDLLGEHKEYLFHPCEEVHPVLREVPWCVIDN